MGQRCEFEHERYGKYKPSRVWDLDGDEPGCCVRDTAQFYSDTGPKHFCLLHAPTGLEPENGGPWPLASREGDQANLLRKLVVHWAKKTTNLPEANKKTLVLPGIHCGAIDFEYQAFPHDIDLTDAIFTDDVGFKKAAFSGKAEFTGTTFTQEVEFGGATFTGDSKFGRTTFKDEAWFHNTTFSGIAEFNGATFTGNANFDHAKFTKIAWFDDVTFGKKAWFFGAIFTAQTWFDRATFYERLYFVSTTFEHHISVNNAFFLGRWLFTDNQFESPASLNHCWINRLTYNTHSGAQLSLNACRTVDVMDGMVIDAENEEPLLGILDNGARSKKSHTGWLDFANQHCEHITFQHMDLSRADFAGADISKTRFISCRWHHAGRGTYTPAYLDAHHAGAADRSDAQALETVENLYQQLKGNLEDHKHYAQAGDFHFHEMETRRAHLRAKGGHVIERGMLRFYKLFADYGESYPKLAVWMLVTLLITASGISLFEYISLDCSTGQTAMPADCATVKTGAAQATGFYNTVLGSLPKYGYKTVVGLLPFATSKAVGLAALSPYSKTLIAMEGLTLVTLATLFIMSIRRRFRR